MREDEPASEANDPFVAPASFDELDRATRAASETATEPPRRRPLNLVVLQLVTGADLFVGALGFGVGAARLIAHGVRDANPLVWLVRPLTVTALMLALVLSLSRSLPNALLISRFAGANWWLYVLYRTLATYADPRMSSVQRVALGAGVALSFALVLPLFFHKPTRAYLTDGAGPRERS
jgi:hypothetical protein